MVDFRSQLQKGLSAHEVASKAKGEVSLLLRRLNEAVQEETAGVISIEMQKYMAIVQTKSNSYIGRTLELLEPKREEREGLFAVNNHTAEKGRLCEWTQDKFGYPCILHYDNQRIEANDEKSLEIAIGELLASPNVGSIIGELASHSPAPP